MKQQNDQRRYLVAAIVCVVFMLVDSLFWHKIRAFAGTKYIVWPIFVYEFIALLLMAVLLRYLFRAAEVCPPAFGAIIGLCAVIAIAIIAVYRPRFGVPLHFLHVDVSTLLLWPLMVSHPQSQIVPVSVIVCLLLHVKRWAGARAHRKRELL